MRLQQRKAQPEHPRPAFPAVDQAAALRPVEREIAENREPVGMLARGLDRERVGIGIPSRRMDHRGRDAGFVHLLERVVRAVVGNLTMVRVWLAAFPDVDLRVDDQHALLPAFRSARGRGRRRAS